jgi:hypothetical protein
MHDDIHEGDYVIVKLFFKIIFFLFFKVEKSDQNVEICGQLSRLFCLLVAVIVWLVLTVKRISCSSGVKTSVLIGRGINQKAGYLQLKKIRIFYK